MDILYIVMPAYNEEECIKDVLKQWYPVLDGKPSESRIVIADSGSNDRTHGILLEQKGRYYPKLEILDNTDRFHGPKIISLYEYAIINGADYIFQTDSDGQTNPKEFETFWDERTKYDGIFGNRTDRGDGKIRTAVEYIISIILKIIFGVNIPDANAPFRLMKADVVKKYLYRMPKDYTLPNIMMTTYYAYYKEKMTFKEITFGKRIAGKNSINISKIIRIGWKALGDFMRFRSEMKHL